MSEGVRVEKLVLTGTWRHCNHSLSRVVISVAPTDVCVQKDNTYAAMTILRIRNFIKKTSLNIYRDIWLFSMC